MVSIAGSGAGQIGTAAAVKPNPKTDVALDTESKPSTADKAKTETAKAPEAEKKADKPADAKPAEAAKEKEDKGINPVLLDLNLEQLFILLQVVPIDKLKTMSEDELKQYLAAKIEERAAVPEPPLGGLNIGGSPGGLFGGFSLGNSDPSDFRVTGPAMAGFDPNMPAAAPWGMTTNPLFGGFMPDPFAGFNFLSGPQNAWGAAPPAFSFF